MNFLPPTTPHFAFSPHWVGLRGTLRASSGEGAGRRGVEDGPSQREEAVYVLGPRLPKWKELLGLFA